jgi:microtubule-associated protein-like 1/2
MQVCTSPLNTIKYSPDGSALAMGSHNGTVHTFSASVNNTYKRNGRKDVGASIMHLDWSKDGDQIQVGWHQGDQTGL